jgi:hypothetical protein
MPFSTRLTDLKIFRKLAECIESRVPDGRLWMLDSCVDALQEVD